MNIQNHEGLLIDADTNSCLGYLIHFPGRGVYSPDGKMDIDPETAHAHNEVLTAAEIKGLDENCKVGMGGTFYYSQGNVTTWTGTLVTNHVHVAGQVITFHRGGKTYRGRLQKDAECFNFRRVS